MNLLEKFKISISVEIQCGHTGSILLVLKIFVIFICNITEFSILKDVCDRDRDRRETQRE